MRTARSDGTAVRWAYGVFLTLCVALAVLVHHETPGTAMASMHAPAPPAHAAHAAHAAADEEMPFPSETSVHGVESDACCMPSLQHCTSASIDSVQFTAPGRSGVQSLAELHRATERTPVGTVGRAPPNLAVLSQLRI